MVFSPHVVPAEALHNASEGQSLCLEQLYEPSSYFLQWCQSCDEPMPIWRCGRQGWSQSRLGVKGTHDDEQEGLEACWSGGEGVWFEESWDRLLRY